MNENFNGGQHLSSEEEHARIVEAQKQELMRRREAGELAPDDYDVNYIEYLQQMDMPVTRKDVENHAILIRPNEFEALAYIEFINADGEKVILDFTDEGFNTSSPLIIFPEELGEEEPLE